MKTWVDADARRAIEHDLDVNLIVEAAAGTGKTTALVRRIVALIASGRARLASIVCVTFTEKAAGEMKLRLRGALERARSDAGDGAEGRERFTEALAELEISMVGTIHGFCAELLRQRPVEAKIDPRFVVLDEGQAQRLYDEAFHDWFESQLAEPGPGVARVLRRKARDFTERASPRSLLYEAGRRLCDERDMTAAWDRPQFERARMLDDLLRRTAQLAELAKVAAHPDDVLAKGVLHVASVMGSVQRREELEGADAPRDYDAIEEAFRASFRGWSGKLWTYRGFKPMFGGGYRKDDVLKLRDPLREDWKHALMLADAELASLLREDLRALVARYESLLERRGALDFSGLLLRARDLLTGSPELCSEMRERYTHVLLDEFQDTDPTQVDIVRCLTCNEGERRPLPGRLFVVGDPKQSIYRFRRADVRLYQRVKQEWLAAGAKLVHLSTNFRSTPAILELCNATFALTFAEQGGRQPEYVPMQPAEHAASEQPAVVALPVPKPYSEKSGKISNWAVEQSYPDAVAAFVRWLVHESGWTVRHGKGRVPVQPRHVCLLFRRFSSFGEDLTRPYVRALEARKLPHVLVGGRSFYAREEVQATLSALSAIERPDDELMVYATLRGPFFALADDALLAYRNAYAAQRGGGISPLNAPLETAEPRVAAVIEALALLKELHYARNRRPIAGTLSELYARTRAQAGVALWPAGEQALSNLLRLLDVARREDSLGTVGFRAFVERVTAETAAAGASEAPAVEEGADGVRLMTVHKAKGLEFPVVILVDPTSPQRPDRPSRWADPDRRLSLQALAGCMPWELAHEHADDVLAEDEAENTRLSYVAATRARDLLVVPVVGDEELEGWAQALRPGVYPHRDERHDSRPSSFHPTFGTDAVLERPSACRVDAYESVRPGLIRPRVGSHSVSFWDPHALVLDVAEQAGVRQQRILAADDDPAREAASKGAYQSWRENCERELRDGGAPTRLVRAVTRMEGAAEPTAIEIVRVDRGARRSAGKRFGTLVHALFAAVAPAQASLAVLQKAAATFARALGASEDEVADAASAVLAAWAHPLLVRAQAAATLRHEWPIEFDDQTSGARVHGVLDAAFFEPGQGWTVVDFKTDRDVQGEESYRDQLARYTEAVRRATGEPARGVLMYV